MTRYVWHLPTLSAEQTEVYHEFLRIPALSMGLYRLPAGGTDPQSPHQEDETYYVLKGRAHIEIEGERYPAQPGDLIFVPAQAVHRFVDITEDLELLVFFAPAESHLNL